MITDSLLNMKGVFPTINRMQERHSIVETPRDLKIRGVSQKD